MSLLFEQLPPLPVLAVSLALAAAMAWYLLSADNTRTKDGKLLLKMAPIGMLDVITNLGGPRGPFWILETARKLGVMNYRLRLPGIEVCIVGDCQLTRDILQDKLSDKPRQFYKAFQGTGAKTMFSSSYDPYMRSIRKATAHAFSKNEVGRMRSVAAKYVDQWMNGRLKELAKSGTPFNPAREFNLITFLVICEAAFEYNASKEEFDFFEHHAEITQREFIGKSPFNPLRAIFGAFIPSVREARDSMTAILKFCGHVLDTYRKNPSKSTNSTLIKILNDNTSIESEFQRQSEVKDWLTAGHDTTGYSLANTLTLLAKHPQVQSKLQEELLQTTGVAAEECEYFKHVMKESMRVMPVAAGGSGRVTGQDYELKDGTVVPKGSICFTNQYLMNHNADVYGENVDQFCPERWEDPTDEMKVAMSPFALGARACPGQPLAMSEINAVLPTILQKYSFELVTEGTPTNFLTFKYLGTQLIAKELVVPK